MISPAGDDSGELLRTRCCRPTGAAAQQAKSGTATGLQYVVLRVTATGGLQPAADRRGGTADLQAKPGTASELSIGILDNEGYLLGFSTQSLTVLSNRGVKSDLINMLKDCTGTDGQT